MALASKSQLALFSYLVYEPPPVNQFIPPIGWVLVPALSEQDSLSGLGIKHARLPLFRPRRCIQYATVNTALEWSFTGDSLFRESGVFLVFFADFIRLIDDFRSKLRA